MYCTIYSKSSRETQSQWSKLKKKKRVNKKHTGTLLPFAKASAVNLYLYLCWTLTVPIATTHNFGFKTVPLLKAKPRLFNLATVRVRLTGSTWLIADEFSDSANHAGASRRAGTAGKSAFDVRAAETRATELLLSDTACVWAKKAVSPDVTPRRASEEKAE